MKLIDLQTVKPLTEAQQAGWDRQITEDVQAGKLDHLLEALDAELAEGELEEL